MVRSAETEEYRALLRTLIAARKESGLTQQQVADRLGRPQSYISKIEQGERRIDVAEFLRFAAAIKLDVRTALKSAGVPVLEPARAGRPTAERRSPPPAESARQLEMAIAALRGAARYAEELMACGEGTADERVARTANWARRIAKEARQELRRLGVDADRKGGQAK